MERSLNSKLRKNTPKGVKNHFAILKEEEVIEICKYLQDTNMTLKEIASIFNVEKSTISNIKRKIKWKHISKDYIFKIRNQKNKKDSEIQRNNILKLLEKKYKPKDIVKMGYPNSVVYRLTKIK